jgi:EcsC protein family
MRSTTCAKARTWSKPPSIVHCHLVVHKHFLVQEDRRRQGRRRDPSSYRNRPTARNAGGMPFASQRPHGGVFTLSDKVIDDVTSTRQNVATREISAYEAEQIGQIVAWKSEPVNPIAEAWNLTVLQAAKFVTVFIPDALVRSAIELTYTVAQKLAPGAGIERQAGVRNISELRQKSLEICDQLAAQVSIAARSLATVEGAITGVGGMATTAIDVPLLLASALRTIIQIGRLSMSSHIVQREGGLFKIFPKQFETHPGVQAEFQVSWDACDASRSRPCAGTRSR